MKIWAKYQERIIPEKLERVKNGPEYVEAIIPFMCEIVEGRSKEIEKATGIKEIEYSHVLKLNYENKEPIIFKKDDRVYLYDKEYRVQETTETIPDKWKYKASKSRALYERYVEYVVFIK
ncbi:hypothetical protein [Methanoculleus sp.]|uniref:hypothetical protein n=1 Tax=Methanoculleus sp. TaxID=90427 RepID=UPI0025F22C9A|nr:hypothetical protein [Methanoculleus sp.]MCK9319556.1 hypothetical protein [Methanoculleus sp.]